MKKKLGFTAAPALVCACVAAFAATTELDKPGALVTSGDRARWQRRKLLQ